MRPLTMICLIVLTLAHVMALPGRAPGEAKPRPGVYEQKEQPPTPPVQVIRRVSVEESLPVGEAKMAQAGGTSKPKVQATTTRTIISRPVVRRG